METRANYILVGGFVVAFFFGLIGFLIWLADFQFEATYDIYDIRFEGSVSGLQNGAPVRFQGVRVGEVTRIALDPENSTIVDVRIEVLATTPVRSDTVASLDLAGLTGGQYVHLSNKTADAPPLVAEPGERYPVIPSQPSALETVFEEAPEILQSVNAVLARAQVLLSNENLYAVSEILNNLSDVTGAVAAEREAISSLIVDAGETLRNMNEATVALRGLMENLEEDSGELGDQAKATLQSVDDTVQELQQAIAALTGDLQDTSQSVTRATNQLNDMIAENRSGILDFTSTGLYEFTNLLGQARTLLSQLNRVTTQVERDPARFFFGDRQQGYDVPRE